MHIAVLSTSLNTDLHVLTLILSSYSLLAASLSARLTLVWLLESMDMPSSYMNLAARIEEIRDNTLSASLARARVSDVAAGVSRTHVSALN